MNIIIGDFIYFIENNVKVLEFQVLDIVYDEKNNYKRFKLKSNDMGFEVDFIGLDRTVMYTDKSLVHAVVTKNIFDLVNTYVKQISGGEFNNYFELDDFVQVCKNKQPQLFL